MGAFLKVLAAATAIGFCCTSSMAQIPSRIPTDVVMQGCRKMLADSREEYWKQFYCLGLVAGAIFTSPDCHPLDVSLGQAMRVVVKYVDSHPERMHEDFRTLAVDAFIAAWPCGKRG